VELAAVPVPAPSITATAFARCGLRYIKLNTSHG